LNKTVSVIIIIPRFFYSYIIAYFYAFFIGLWNCSDHVVFFVFLFLILIVNVL